MESLQVLRLVKDRNCKINNVCSLLEPISNSNDLFEQQDMDNNSEDGDIADPFLEQSSMLARKQSNEKDADGNYGNVSVLDDFPETHIRLLREVQEKQDNSFHIEKIDYQKPEAESEDDEEFQNAIAMLKDCGMSIYEEEKRKRLEKEKTRQKQRPKKSKNQDEQEIEINSLSGVWRLLEAESMNNEFPLTQMGYNFYAQKDKDWIKRKESKTWNQIEITRKKCEEWLKNIKS